MFRLVKVSTITPGTVTRDSHYLLALATLGGVTLIEMKNDPISVTPPKVAKASSMP